MAYLPKFTPAVFTPLDANQLVSLSPTDAQALATQTDLEAYRRADEDFATRHQSVMSSERAAEAQLLRQMQGDIDPIQGAALVRSGLGAAFAMTGGAGGVTPGSIGSFAVSKRIGLNFLLLQQGARTALAGFNARTQPRRIGIDGAAVVRLLTGADQTYNEVQIGNFLGQNEVSISNAVNRYQHGLANFQNTPQDEGFFHRILNGGLTGFSEGFTYGNQYGGFGAGIIGGVFGALGGAADGAMSGPLYNLHAGNHDLYLGSTGSNGMTYSGALYTSAPLPHGSGT